MAWTDNAIMWWGIPDSNGNVSVWNKITDHNRQPLSISNERLGTSNRTVGGTLRRHTVAKKRTISVSWSMIPSKRNSVYGGKTGLTTVDNGWAGDEIEQFYKNNDGMFKVKLRAGTDEAKSVSDSSIEVINVMITDFSKVVEKRGVVDFWSLDITLEEV